MHATLGHDLLCFIPNAVVLAIVVNVECEMVLHIGQVPVLVSNKQI